MEKRQSQWERFDAWMSKHSFLAIPLIPVMVVALPLVMAIYTVGFLVKLVFTGHKSKARVTGAADPAWRPDGGYTNPPRQ